MLRRFAGKVVVILLKKYVLQAVGSLQLCGGFEAAIHAMRDIFNDDSREGIVLIDAENDFNSINRKAMLHNLIFICPVIAIYTYRTVTCVQLDCLSSVEKNYYLTRV